jgi:hypothetical protein
VKHAYAAILIAAAVTAPGARAQLTEGDECKLQREVSAKMVVAAKGDVETSIEAGKKIKVTKPGRFFTRLMVGDVLHLVPTEELEVACPIEREMCRLKAPIKMAAGDQAAGERRKIFKVGADAEIIIVGRGPRRTRVVVGDVHGEMNSQHLEQLCVPIDANKPKSSGTKTSKTDKLPAVPPGAKVGVMPFAMARQINPREAQMLEEQLADALKGWRSDVMGPGTPRPDEKLLRQDFKKHLEFSRERAARMGLTHMVTGHLSGDGTRLVLGLGVVDVKTGKLLKGVRARPTFQAGDPWAQDTAGLVQVALPGGKAFTPKKRGDATEVATQDTRVATGGSYARPPFYANGLAWTTLGLGAALAASGAGVGFWATTDVETNAATPVTDPARTQAANTAMTKAIVADSLYGAAAVAALTSIVFFATGLDW